jgi:hypothetical protein
MLIARPVWAQRIILVCPPEADASLTEAFNRLRGELSMHGFEIEIQTAASAISPKTMAERAESQAAVASVSFARSAGIATADITISDRVTGKTTVRTIATPVGTDTASLLALRAVELLRASLREFGPHAKAPKDIVGATPERATPQIEQWVQAPARSELSPRPGAPIVEPLPRAPSFHRLTLRADLLSPVLFPNPHLGYGVGANVGFEWRPRFEMRIGVELPWVGLDYTSSHATSRIRWVNVSGDAAYSWLVTRRIELQLLAGMGLLRLTMYTTTNEPWEPLRPAAWLLMPRLGLDLSANISPRWFWHVSSQLAALLPRTHLYVTDQKYTLGLPLILLSMGMGARF